MSANNGESDPSRPALHGGSGLGGTGLTMTEAVHDELLAMATNPLETAAVVLARQIGEPSQTRLVVTAVHPVPERAYLVREWDRLEIASDGYMDSLSEAERTGTVALWVHTHPGDDAVVDPSRHDRLVNDQLRDVFAMRSQPGVYGWLVLGCRNGRLTFTGAVEAPDGDRAPISMATVVGHGIRRIRAQQSRPIPDESDSATALTGREAPKTHDSLRNGEMDLFDRNIRALGFDVQRIIAEMVFAVVGAGGTGSAVAEQLVRLGARRLVVIDPDTLSLSNVTRVYGSTPADVGLRKVDVLAAHLRRIAPDLDIRAVEGTITTEEVARELLAADLVFGCTDDNAGRMRLSRLPYYYLIPVIDCGIQLTSDANDIIDGIFGRVTVITPATACLMCRGRVDVARAEAELRDAATQARLEKENYAPALPGVEPALVPFTTMTAAWALSELVERLIGYGERPTPSELLLMAHDRTVRANIESPRPGHYCDPTVAISHDPEMFLGMNW